MNNTTTSPIIYSMNTNTTSVNSLLLIIHTAMDWLTTNGYKVYITTALNMNASEARRYAFEADMRYSEMLENSDADQSVLKDAQLDAIAAEMMRDIVFAKDKLAYAIHFSIKE